MAAQPRLRAAGRARPAACMHWHGTRPWEAMGGPGRDVDALAGRARCAPRARPRPPRTQPQCSCCRAHHHHTTRQWLLLACPSAQHSPRLRLRCPRLTAACPALRPPARTPARRHAAPGGGHAAARVPATHVERLLRGQEQQMVRRRCCARTLPWPAWPPHTPPAAPHCGGSTALPRTLRQPPRPANKARTTTCTPARACGARRIYTNLTTGQAQLEHPLIDYYRGAVFMDQASATHVHCARVRCATVRSCTWRAHGVHCACWCALGRTARPIDAAALSRLPRHALLPLRPGMSQHRPSAAGHTQRARPPCAHAHARARTCSQPHAHTRRAHARTQGAYHDVWEKMANSN